MRPIILIFLFGFFLSDISSIEAQPNKTSGNSSSQGNLSGRVLDDKSGTPLQGVNISVENNRKGTVTDPDCYFLISNLPEAFSALLILKPLKASIF